MWAIEFRNGGFFQTQNALHSVGEDAAMQFPTKLEAETFMEKHPWIYFNGGMVVELSDETSH